MDIFFSLLAVSVRRVTFCLAKFNQTFAEIRKRHTLCNSFVDILERRFKVESLVILILTRLPVFKKKKRYQSNNIHLKRALYEVLFGF